MLGGIGGAAAGLRSLRLTAELVVAASHCKHKYLDARKPDYRVNWGDSGGTRHTAFGAVPKKPVSRPVALERCVLNRQ
jgi:hypothetical protein